MNDKNDDRLMVAPFIGGDALPWQELGSGVRRKVVAHTPMLMAVLVEFKAGAIGQLHHHDVHDQISYVLKGSFEVQVGGEKRQLAKGDAFIAEHPKPHGVIALEADSQLLDVFSPRRDEFLSH